MLFNFNFQFIIEKRLLEVWLYWVFFFSKKTPYAWNEISRVYVQDILCVKDNIFHVNKVMFPSQFDRVWVALGMRWRILLFLLLLPLLTVAERRHAFPSPSWQAYGIERGERISSACVPGQIGLRVRIP